ncbi:uncharacterized protein LOC126830170 isoform X1 [Patella vulgata]|uniref:uncharacterized protein LOC126830170 isoform X1 n=1 Tax=Patella vulgata TaxID=6465 RepID=UPI0024A99940|nr:uncharacterized protein LOC126830170 isoform X1 [Patella vulgata]XP_050416431.2 uncharacterized protein LOC126830170 isoform X1 [Patella vulgata]XP_050416432.2 uncharacterized protein LOC126830170 isoform X1 [Patella vulgata]
MSVEIEANTSTIIEKKYTMFLSHNHGRDINIKQEPVESSDSEENDKSESDLDDSEKLSAIMIKCKISSTESKILKENDDKKEDACEKEICSKLSKVTLKEKNDDGKDIEVIVENIKKEDECREKKRALGSNGLDTRGPTGGIPATFSQNQHIVQTQYQNGYSYSQSIPYYQQPQQNQYGGYDNNQYVNNMTNGKRRPEEDDETPYKYQAPNIVREGMNNLNIPVNIQPENVTNQCHMSGGMMSVQNTFMDAGGMLSAEPAPFSPYIPSVEGEDLCNFDFANAFIGNEEPNNQNFTTPPFRQIPLTNCESVSPDFLQDGGSEGYGSPGHESQYSTMGVDSPAPRSNLSEDSGISSPDNRNLDAASPSSNMSVNSGSPKSNVYAPNLGMPQQYTNTDSMSCDQTTHFSNYQTTEVNPQPSDCDWEDLLDIVHQDEIRMENKKRQQSGETHVTNSSNNLKDNLNPNTIPTTLPRTSVNVVTGNFNTINKPASQPVVMPQASVNNCKPFIPATPVNMGTPVAVTLPPMGNSNQSVPVNTGQIFFIAQAPQPVFLVNQGPLMNKQPAKRPIKPNYVPIRPKLDPVASKESQHSSPAHSPKSSELKSRVPATVTAAVKDNSTVQPVTNKKSPLPPSSTTCPSNNVVNTSSSSQSKKLNVARRHIAKLTSTDLRFQDDEGDTYLHAAVCKDSNNITDFVQALLERLEREKLIGMIDVFNVRRQTPLYCAVSANHPNIIEMMIRYGADVNTLAERMVHGGTVREVRAAIHVAASNGKEYLETLNALLKSRELNLNIANSDGQTALHCAILCHNKAKQDSIDCIDSTPIIETLIQHGADINAQDKKSGKTPLMYALESRSLHLIHTVVKQIKQDKMRMYLRTQSFDGNTPQKILESLKTVLDVNSWQKVHDMLMCSNKDINGFNIHQ